MNTHYTRVKPVPGRWLRWAICATLALTGAKAQTWSGLGGDNFWGTTANWTGGTPIPSATTDIAFSGSTRLANSNNLTALGSFRNVTFNAGAGAFTLTGNSIRLLGKIRNDSTSTQALNFDIDTGSAGYVELDPAAGNLTLGGTQVLLGGNQLRVVGNGGKTLTFGSSTIISGSTGSFLLSANSTVIFKSAHNYGGGTTVSAGTLALGDGTTNGTPNGTYQVNSPGMLRIRYNSSGIVTALWTSALWNTFTGHGTLALATAKSNDTWGSAALPSGFTGTLQIEGGRVVTNSVTGAGFGGATAIKILSGGQLTDWMGSTITQDFTIAGTGYGEGGLECAIRMGDGSNTSTLSGLVTLSANATIGANGTGILTNVVSGAAGLTLGTSYCNGKVILAANNTYSGNTTIAYGTLQIGNGGATGSLGAGAVTNNGTLVFYRTGAVNVGQAITGSGALKQIGSGTVTLAVANSYGGATTINSGTLAFGCNAALPAGSAISIGSATLNAGTYANSAGTLGVTGNANIVLGSGATLAFANSSALSWIGSLQLSGNFVSGASVRVGTNSSGLTAAQLERIYVTGYSGFALNSQGYLTATPLPLYSAWQTANGTTQSITEDLDGDGVPNGLEYFLHGAANSSSADVLPGVINNAGTQSITWTKASSYPGVYGTDFAIQTSSTLTAGSWITEALGTNVVITGNDVKYSFPTGTKNFARLVVYGVPQTNALLVDTSNAIPLRSHIYRKDMFALSLRGSAISGTTPFEANFDTGSQQTCLPYGALNKANLTVVQTNIRTVWGRLADKVTGQLMLKSRDGLTDYTLDNYTFYAMKNEDGSDMADDRTQPWSVSICGAGPIDDSIVAALMTKYSTNGLGAGIISESPGGELLSNWSLHKSYLKFGNDPAVASRLNWYYWSPWYTGQTEFDPITIPGFKFTYHFPAVSGQTYPDIVIPNQIATIDSGAPELVMRMGATDPHRSPPYSQFFNSTNVPFWYNTADCQAVNYGVTLNVEFTGSTGKSNSYTFPSANNNGAYIPNVIYIGNWASNVPWTPNSTTMPMNRMNLGNSVYFFAKVYFWDFTNKRVGFFFN